MEAEKEIELFERVARMETKLDIALSYSGKVIELDKDMSMIKRTIRFIWGAIVVVAGFFGSKSS